MNRRNFLKWTLVSLAACSVWAVPWHLSNQKQPGRKTVTDCPPNGGRSLTLMAVGDIMMHLPVSRSALQSDGHYDFKPHFQYVRPLFKNADLVLGNLETPLAGGALSGYPMFNGPDELIDGLQWAGVTALNLANNHSLDQGWAGLTRTAEQVNGRGIIYFGGYLSAEDQAAARLFSVAGVTVGLEGYTYGVNGPWKYPHGESWRLNFVDEAAMVKDIAGLKSAGADFVVINVHFGDEYQRVPNQRQLKLVAALFAAGADLVIGHHPHVVQPGLMRPAGAGDEAAAIFSLGNFISNQRDKYTDQGLMVTASLNIDRKGRKSLSPIILHQTRCIRRVVEGRPTYRVLPVYEALAHPAAYGLTAEEAAFLAKDQLSMGQHLTGYEV